MTSNSPTVAASQSNTGKSETRFAFGRNWQHFLQNVDEERIAEAEKSLCSMLEIQDLRGKSFLDVGCGSGLFSVAAMRLAPPRELPLDSIPKAWVAQQH